MELTKIDLNGVERGGPGWSDVRAAVTASMVAHGCAVVAHDRLSPVLLEAVFARALPQLFALPLEVKQQAVCTDGFRGYMRGIAGINSDWWESLRIDNPADAASVRGMADLLWPEGNPEFCETIVSFAENMLKLEEMVETLVLQGLGVRAEGVRGHLGLLDHAIRISHYGTALDSRTESISMLHHYDDTMVTMAVQHEVEGLEVHVGDGRWVSIPPEPGVFIIIAGEQLRVATNGRVPACLHRVRTPSNRERFSMQFTSRQKVGVTVSTLEDLVDAEHPLLFNPLRHEEYTKFRYSEEGMKMEDPLKMFCGVEKIGTSV